MANRRRDGRDMKEPEMIEFVVTARGLFFRCHLGPEALILIVIGSRLCHQLL